MFSTQPLLLRIVLVSCWWVSLLTTLSNAERRVKLESILRQPGGYVAISTLARDTFQPEIVPLTSGFRFDSVPRDGLTNQDQLDQLQVSVLRVVPVWSWFRKKVKVCIYAAKSNPLVSVPKCQSESNAVSIRSLRLFRPSSLGPELKARGVDPHVPFRMAWYVANRWLKHTNLRYRVPFGHWLYVFPADMRHLLSTPGQNQLEITIASTTSTRTFSSHPWIFRASGVYRSGRNFGHGYPAASGGAEATPELPLSEKSPNHPDAKSDKTGAVVRRTLQASSPVVGETCSICQDTLETGKDVALCQCDQVHPYCFECLEEWDTHCKKRFPCRLTCPCCNRYLQETRHWSHTSGWSNS